MSHHDQVLSGKQLEIFKIVVGGNGFLGNANGVQVLIPIDLDELVKRLPYKPSKHSLQFTIRALVAKGMITKGPTENRRGRMGVVYLPTDAGKFCVSPNSASDVSLGTGNIEANGMWCSKLRGTLVGPITPATPLPPIANIAAVITPRASQSSSMLSCCYFCRPPPYGTYFNTLVHLEM